ncbi:hypothetical protein KC19_3G141900 [Ceratodon purpureus]|uniref:Uncharacterized protein n=1 Tax=Ceratodon purpureus TaxID=3225 RepID=A0A8T0II75_CERPU|nr:hypothetical protein KC19_3G141900 [Ceratodon purpureus]
MSQPRLNEAYISVASFPSGCVVAWLAWASGEMGSSIPMQHLQSCSSELGSQDALLGASEGSFSCSSGGHSKHGSGHVAIDVPDGSRAKLVTNEIEANSLLEIHKDERLSLILADWEKKLKESQVRKERKQALSLNVKNEIYHLIGFFSVFQGVVLTAVSQASQLTCHNWWGPFALSLLASITTLVGVCHKFYNFIIWKRATDVEVCNSKVLKTQISKLKKFGRRFNFAEHAPDIIPRGEVPHQFVRYYILGSLVVASMLGFSAIMLISCQKILCDN